MGRENATIYKSTAGRIHRAIIAGELHDRLPGERELAELYNVSRVTVRKAIGLLLEAGAVHRVARKGTFVGGASVSEIIPERKRIAYCIFGEADAGLLPELSKLCSAHDYHLFIEYFTDSSDMQKRMPEIKRFEKPDIAVLYGYPTPFSAEYIQAQGIPVLWIAQLPVGAPRDKYDCCCLNWYNWGYRAARYFIAQGCRRIALITGDSAEMANIELIEGMKTAHEEEGVVPPGGLLVSCRQPTMQAGFDAVLSLIELEFPDAIITSNNALGNGVAMAAAQIHEIDPIPIVTTGGQSSDRLNIYPLKYLNYDPEDAASKIWRLLRRRLSHPGAAAEIVHPVWKFN